MPLVVIIAMVIIYSLLRALFNTTKNASRQSTTSSLAQTTHSSTQSHQVDRAETFEIPRESSPDLQKLATALRVGSTAVLLHGRAGTGKTTLIRELVKSPKLRYVITAPTGVAAINVAGQTIHSFFGIAPHVMNLEDIRPSHKLRNVLRNIDLLIIDEISMVRADLLDVIDKKLRVNLNNEKPFGGLQVLMVGDFLQLPPVVPDEDKEILEKKGYQNFYALDAKVVSIAELKIVELDKVHRQNELEFIEMLGKLRSGNEIPAVLQSLNSRCYGIHKYPTEPIILSARRTTADDYNRKGMAKLTSKAFSYTASVTGDFRSDRFPVDHNMELKVGARVMLAKNDPNKNWVNGSMGEVTRLTEQAVWVRLQKTGCEHEVSRATWENIKYEWVESKRRVEKITAGTFSQFPIKLAWAMTIHKSQGLTLESVRIDLEGGAFAHGQTYVALSRATSLGGLSFTHPLSVEDVKVDHDLVETLANLSL